VWLARGPGKLTPCCSGSSPRLSSQLRVQGVQAYGLGSVSEDGDSARIHGNDERVSVAGLRTFLEYLWTAVVDVAGPPN